MVEPVQNDKGGVVMITLYSGNPGSGKSLHMAKDIWIACNRSVRNKLVICNFEVNTDGMKHPERYMFLPNEELTPQRLIDISNEYFKDKQDLTVKQKEGLLLLYIDEAQVIFNSRDWNAKGRRDWITFFTQHRKYGYDIFLVSQFDLMIDKQMRALIEYEVTHRVVTNGGFFGMLIYILFFGKTFICVRRWYNMKGKAAHLGHNYVKPHKRYYSLYDTFNTFNAALTDAEGQTTKPIEGIVVVN